MSWDIFIKMKHRIALINISFNPFSLQDLPSVLAIECLSYPHPWSEQQFIDSLNNPQIMADLILLDGKIIGYALSLRAPDFADLLNICIHPKKQRRGLGEALFNRVLQQLQSIKITTIFLEVRSSNQSAFLFYQQLGFEIIDTRKAYYSNGEDAKIMRFQSAIKK
ncbi:MAG: ribosomal-protein-alanine N-acetyltransferase [Candidatus Thioglobus sp.]|nr:MAG: ribosomal-protein-alanine N-acetyltransferase [Candidatus Thioglobus sp.]